MSGGGDREADVPRPSVYVETSVVSYLTADLSRDIVTLAHQIQDAIGRSHKVLPTALVASVMRPHLTRSELIARLDERLGRLAEAGANLAVRTGKQAAAEGVALLVARDVLVEERQTIRVRDRITLRYYARTISHLLAPPRRTTH